jgi:hypothetical protein
MPSAIFVLRNTIWSSGELVALPAASPKTGIRRNKNLNK